MPSKFIWNAQAARKFCTPPLRLPIRFWATGYKWPTTTGRFPLRPPVRLWVWKRWFCWTTLPPKLWQWPKPKRKTWYKSAGKSPSNLRLKPLSARVQVWVSAVWCTAPQAGWLCQARVAIPVFRRLTIWKCWFGNTLKTNTAMFLPSVFWAAQVWAWFTRHWPNATTSNNTVWNPLKSPIRHWAEHRLFAVRLWIFSAPCWARSLPIWLWLWVRAAACICAAGLSLACWITLKLLHSAAALKTKAALKHILPPFPCMSYWANFRASSARRSH